jgi:prophage regulatory protein
MTIWKLKKLMAEVPLSKSSIYAKIKEGTFPAPIPLGGRAVGWLQSEIEAWVTTQAAAPRRLCRLSGAD